MASRLLNKLLNLARLALFFLALPLLAVTAAWLAPSNAGYAAAAFIIYASFFLLGYYAPQKTLPCLFLFLPFAGLPSRVLNLGAHQASVFLVLFYALGYYANRLVTGKSTPFSGAIKAPLLAVAAVGAVSWLFGTLELAFFSLSHKTPFFYDRIVNCDGLTASVALRSLALSALTCMVLPAMLWLTLAQTMERPDKEERKAFLISLFRCLTFGFLPVLCLAFYQHFFNSSFAMLQGTAWIEAGRVSGGMTDPNALGVFAALYAPLSILLAVITATAWRFLYGFTGFLALWALTFSGSRTSILIVLFSAGAYGFLLLAKHLRQLRESGRIKSLLAPIGAIFIGLLILAAFAPSCLKILEKSRNPVAVRISRHLSRASQKDGGILDRRDLQWKQALNVWKEYPMAGLGLGRFPMEVPNYNREAGMETPTDNPWNQYLTWGVEMGVLGLLAWLWLVFAISKNQWRQGHAPFISCLLCAFALASLFGAHLQSPEVAIIIGLLLAALLSTQDPAPTPISRKAKIALALLVIAQCACLSAKGPSAIEKHCARFELAKDFGFYGTETWQGSAFRYRWCAPRAGFYLEVPKESRIIKLRIGALNPSVNSGNPQIVTFYYDGTMLDTVVLDDPEWREIKLLIFPWLANNGLLCIATSQVYQPAGEMRSLGIAVARDYEFTDDFNRQAQGLLGYENLQCGRVALAREGLAWQPAPHSQKVMLNFEMPRHLPFERHSIDYELYQGSQLLDSFTLPLDGKVHAYEKELAGEARPALSIRAKETVSRRLESTRKPKDQGIRVLAISDF